MNLVGKILIVLIFVMSLVFMSFAVAVYATHTNWRLRVMNETPTRENPLGLVKQLQAEQPRPCQHRRKPNFPECLALARASLGLNLPDMRNPCARRES